MIQIENCQLEIDTERGVLYVHSSEGTTLVRVCQIPVNVIDLVYDKENYYWNGMIDIVYDRAIAAGRQ